MSIRLGVNIDHVATIRKARGDKHPEPFTVAKKALEYGADSITIHLREDRRHINDKDLKLISSIKSIPLNLEMASNSEMIKIAIKYKPDFVCIVPEKRKEITTEGGLNIKKNKKLIRKIILRLKKENIRVSLFIEPKISDVHLSKLLGANCIELHTGNYCNLFNKNKNSKKSYENLKKAAQCGKKIDLDVHAGHGLTYKSARNISKIISISEFNIGHFIIAESLFFGLKKTIKKIKYVINN